MSGHAARGVPSKATTPFGGRAAIFLALAVALVFGASAGAQVPVSPILVIVNTVPGCTASTPSCNPFGQYLPEILRAEGINSFSVTELAALDATRLSATRLAILAESPLTDHQTSLLSAYINGGGRLIAMRPDPRLAGVLGVSPLAGQTLDGYVQIDSTNPALVGFPSRSLPFRGGASRYQLLAGAVQLASLLESAPSSAFVGPTAGTATGLPGVIRFGHTATWAFDLARSTAYTRQGDPVHAGQERDGSPPIRTNDVFHHAIDLDVMDLPHGDIQMRLFARVVADLLADAMPLPKLWYFPGAARSLLVLTADSHTTNSASHEALLSAAQARGGRVSVYLSPRLTSPTAAEVEAWRSAGHEIGLHPFGYADNVTLEQGYQTVESWFQTMSWGVPSRTERHHNVEWEGWVEAARTAAGHGIGLDTSFYTWGFGLQYADGRWAHGFLAGSGLPMRFVDEQGVVLPVYQQVTSLVDEQLLPLWGSIEALTPEQALAVSRKFMDDSQTGGYSAVTLQAHVDAYTWPQVRPWADGTMDYAATLGIPMWTAERWWKYSTARVAATVGNLAWSPSERRLQFEIAVPEGSEALSLLLPSTYDSGVLSAVTVDGASVAVTQATILGRESSFFAVAAGVAGAARTVTISYGEAPPNSPPVARDDAVATSMGESVTVAVLTNDSDVDGEALVVSATTQPAQGSVSIGPAATTVVYTPQPGFCGTDAFGYSISDGRGGVASATVTVTVTCGGTWTHTTASDFSGCSVLAGTQVTSVADGEVRLAGALGDDYGGSSLGAQWTPGAWAGGSYGPTLIGGILPVAPGGYVRSTSATSSSTLEASAQFGANPWQHIGWGALDFGGDVYVLFSTYNGTTNLYARTNAGSGEQRTDLGAIPGGFHDYRIERVPQAGGQAQIRFLIDGVLLATHLVDGLPAGLYLYQSNNGTATPTLDVDQIWASPPFVGNGAFESCALDAGRTVGWTTAAWAADVPAGAAVAFRTRTSIDGLSWSSWSPPLGESGQPLASPSGRYLQYRLELSATDTAVTPSVDSVTVGYGPSEPVLTIDDATASEGTGGTAQAVFTVRLSPPSSAPTTVQYSTADGSALAGSDYLSASGALTFAPGATTQSVMVDFIADDVIEPNETFSVTLSDAAGAAIGDATALGTILDDDTPPSLAIDDVQVAEGNSGTGSALFTVTLSRAFSLPVTVAYATADGTAAADSDYAAAAGTLIFAPGVTAQTVAIGVIGDATPETHEIFRVDLSNPVNAVLAGASGTGTILDDDSLVRADALVLVNRTSSGYEDFTTFIKPYLDQFGVPYTVLDVATDPIPVRVGEYAVVVIGHRHLDLGGVYLDDAEQSALTAAVRAGTGLVSFDNDLWAAGSARYQFVQDIFGFAPGGATSGSGVALADNAHYITSRHVAGESFSTGQMALAGVVLPPAVKALATTDGQPLVAVTAFEAGRAVQWGSYSWMSASVFGPVRGLDDLVWRAIVWAARKPFVMQGVPPFVTMRVDDVASPFAPLDWIGIANEAGFKPWLGLFTHDVDGAEASQLSGLVNAGQATAAMHAWSEADFFHWDHNHGTNFPDATLATYYADATNWFQARSIPVSKYTVPHWYEIGPNAFQGLANWGIEFLGIQHAAGTADGGPWLQNGPYRLSEAGVSTSSLPFYYGDFTSVPGHPELEGRFFNCVTEIRDIGGYEWQPNGYGVAAATDQATRWLRRGLDSLVLPTLFTHEYALEGIGASDWRAMMQGIAGSLASYQPSFVTLDYGCQYMRALYTSNIESATYEPASSTIRASLGGRTDIPTKFYVFTDDNGGIVQAPASVPAFSGAAQVVVSLSGGELPTLSVADVTVAEGAGTAAFAVTLSPPSTLSVSVDYVTMNVTAAAGSDYTASAGTLTFTPGGPLTQTVVIGVLEDALDEPDETLLLTLGNAVNATVADSEATGAITDDDPAPALSIGDVTVTEGHSGSSSAVFTVTLAAASGQTVTAGYATADGTATAGSDYTAASGTLTFAPGAVTQTVAVAVLGDVAVEAGETFRVTLANPVNATIADGQGTGTILNDDLPVLSIGDGGATEGNTGSVKANFVVTLVPAATQTVTVVYSTADGTATAVSDYTATTGTLTFAPGETAKQITVVVLGDTRDEPFETFFVNLGSPAGATLGDAQATGMIADNDATPSLRVYDVAVPEGTGGTTTASFSVRLSAASGQTVTVAYATSNSTALAGIDYVATSGSLTFLPGETQKTVQVAVIGDTLDEANETYRVNLSGATNATIADSVAVGTITDDDDLPTVSIGDAPSVIEGNTTSVYATFTVRLSAPSGRSVSVKWATANGTATSGSDYAAASGTLSFAAGVTEKTVRVRVIGDRVVEPDEYFLVSLNTPVNLTIADGQAVGTIVNND